MEVYSCTFPSHHVLATQTKHGAAAPGRPAPVLLLEGLLFIGGAVLKCSFKQLFGTALEVG